MVKKLLFISFLLLSINAFSQKSIEQLHAAPNPFQTSTSIQFSSASSQKVIFIVKNVLGKTIYKEQFNAKKGKNKFPFYRNNLKSGMYIYTITSRKEMHSKRFVIR